MHVHDAADREVVREAAERLLAWGFSAPSIAEQLGMSTSWVYNVRKHRQNADADAEERYLRGEELLREAWTYGRSSTDSDVL